MHFRVSTIHLMTDMRREQANIGLDQMIGHTRKEDILSICVNKLVQCHANANNPVDLGHVLDRYITLHVVNKVTTEWCQAK